MFLSDIMNRKSVQLKTGSKNTTRVTSQQWLFSSQSERIEGDADGSSAHNLIIGKVCSWILKSGVSEVSDRHLSMFTWGLCVPGLMLSGCFSPGRVSQGKMVRMRWVSLAYVTRPEEDTCPPVDPQPAGGTVCVGRQPAAEALGDQSPLSRLATGTWNQFGGEGAWAGVWVWEVLASYSRVYLNAWFHSEISLLKRGWTPVWGCPRWEGSGPGARSLSISGFTSEGREDRSKAECSSFYWSETKYKPTIQKHWLIALICMSLTEISLWHPHIGCVPKRLADYNQSVNQSYPTDTPNLNLLCA